MEKRELITPGSRDSDFLSRFRINELMNHLAELARRHAEETGFGYQAMKDKGLYWVLHRMDLVIERPPLLDEHLEIITRPWFKPGLKADRQFMVLDADGRSIIRAHSLWLLIDETSKRPQLLQRHFSPLGSALFEDHDAETGLQDLPRGSEAGSRKASYADVDVHRHVNNASYVSWCLDLLDEETWKNYYPSRIIVEFKKESFYGENIHLHLSGEEAFNEAREEIPLRFDGVRMNETGSGEDIFYLGMQLRCWNG